ncbi:MAG: metal ABC transporter ATP-binding protein [Lachnospiraceae bacterium]|nr:metal ABC transporter ATP-binding protein [Lachnospiraceae bacterium]
MSKAITRKTISKNCITCKNLTLGYDGQPVAEGISFTINAGDYVVVLGENGAGKSTLMKTLVHQVKPIAGEMHYGDMKHYEIGYLPQKTQVQKDFPASVWEIVLSGCLSRLGKRLFFGKAEKERAMKNLERMAIADLKDKSFRNLSGGQQQRVLLARALCASEKLLLLDEPTAGLDAKTTAELYDMLHKLNKVSGLAIIMVSHDQEAALQHATHVLKVSREDSFFGTVEAYKEKEGNSIG